MNRADRCPECSGGGLVPALGCTCDGNARTCMPAWHALYHAQLAEEAAFDDRLFDPAGLRAPIWFQQVPEAKAGKNRLHLDLYPTGRDNALPMERRIEIVGAKAAELTGRGASMETSSVNPLAPSCGVHDRLAA